ncbi:MAG: cation transporter [Clostridia bacterium]|nr:cation transporter [Clostridia bacterium]
MRKIYKIEVDCAHCAMLCEREAAKVEGVGSAAINFMTQKMTLELEDGADEKKVLKAVIKACRRIERGFDIEL